MQFHLFTTLSWLLYILEHVEKNCFVIEWAAYSRERDAISSLQLPKFHKIVGHHLRCGVSQKRLLDEGKEVEFLCYFIRRSAGSKRQRQPPASIRSLSHFSSKCKYLKINRILPPLLQQYTTHPDSSMRATCKTTCSPTQLCIRKG